MIALDTNLLVYAHRAGASQHVAARNAIEHAASLGAWGIAFPCIAEFWFVVTRPQIMDGPSTAAEAGEFIEELTQAGARIIIPGKGFASRLAAEAKRRRIAGARIFDLQIALMAAEAGATEIWTHDSDFIRVPGLKVVDPL